jgi:hypothetical protein
MATALVIEEESGTCDGFVHPHNGYYAGDFHRANRAPVVAPVLAPVFGRFTDGTMRDSALRVLAGVRHVDDRAVARAA